MPNLKRVISECRERVEKIVGAISSWEESKTQFRFRLYSDITLAQINALSIEFNTDKINFNTGHSGERGYSKYTPSSPAVEGYVEVIF